MKRIDIHALFVNGISTLVFVAVILSLKTGVEFNTMFFSEDSRSYLDMANWISGGEQNIHIARRPFLYPLLIVLIYTTSGIKGLFLVHFFMWLCSSNFVFRSIKYFTNNLFLAYTGLFVFVSNLSLIAFTEHALAEVSTVFLASWLTYYISRNFKNWYEIKFLSTVLLFLSLLTITKPLFLIPTFLYILLVVVTLIINREILHRKKLLFLIVALLPIILQLGMMSGTGNGFKISDIGRQTFTNYLFARGIQINEGTERNEAIDKANTYTSAAQIQYMWKNQDIYVEAYLYNLKQNLRAYPSFLALNKELENENFKDFMIRMNIYYYRIHLLFIIPCLLFLFMLARAGNWTKFLTVIVLFSLTMYIILVSGVSFWQGDRLVLIALPFWICLYAVTTYFYLQIVKKKLKINYPKLS